MSGDNVERSISLVGDTAHAMQFPAIAGAPVQRIILDGQAIGSVWEQDGARFCMLTGVEPGDASRSRPDQARQVFDRIDAALQQAGMTFLNVVRTWLYIDRILDWYGEFNEVRTQFFREHGVLGHVVPASTGVGVDNPLGIALAANALAIDPKGSGLRILPIASPLQCPAPDYRSSFSRAIEITFPDHRMLYVSGTASIDPQGRTAHVGDVDGQIALTMNVVHAILVSRGMHWNDVVRSVAYFKDMAQAPAFDAFCRTHNLPAFPVVTVRADICRGDLLFEIEVDARKS